MRVVNSINTAGLKESVDLIALAERYTTLHKHTGREMAGPCPLPNCTADTDGFHVQSAWWLCYSCHPKRADVIEFLMLAHGVDFREACSMLGGETAALPPVERRSPAPVSDAPDWRVPQWQAKTRARLRAAQAALWSPAGQQAREYLAGRGLAEHPARVFGLGYELVYVKATESRRPAVVIPWMLGDDVTMLKMRFIDDEAKDNSKRYTRRGKGGDLVFGANHALGYDVLLIVEGELNAVAVWQVLRGQLGHVDVVSLGSESTRLADELIALARRYRLIIPWLDKEGAAGQVRAALLERLGPGAPVVEAHTVTLADGRKLDANALLQGGRLADCLRAVLKGVERRRATADPRPDLAADGFSALLAMAYDRDFDDPLGLFGALLGLRIGGARLVREGGRRRLAAGESDPDEHAALRAKYLLPHAQALTGMLAALP